MTILVSGGAGYIGSHTVQTLINEGEDVIIIDNLQTGNSCLLNPHAKFYLGDIKDKMFLDHVFTLEKIEAVMHFASDSIVNESIINPQKYYDNNITGIKTLLEIMTKHNVKKIIFSSSAAVYEENNTIPIKEENATNPTNPYGETKLISEKILQNFGKNQNINYVILRYFNVAGADKSGKLGELHNPETHLIPLILQVANNQKSKLKIYGNSYNTKDGTSIRDYVHVTDVAGANIKSLNYLRAGYTSEIFNVGSGRGYSVSEIINLIKEVTKKEIPTEICPNIPGQPAKLIASIDKIQHKLSWQPTNSDIKNIIMTAWLWQKNYFSKI